MSWFKVDDGLHSHPKVLEAGTAAMGLWVRCGSWASQQLTNGFVPVAVARMYGTPSQVRQLVGSGLWLEVEDGYWFHDWFDCNPSRDHVEAKREARAAAGRKGGLASARVRAGQAEDEANA